MRDIPMSKIDITSRDEKELIRLSKRYEDIFYVKKRDNPLLDGQWTIDDLSDMGESGHQIVFILRKCLKKIKYENKRKHD